MARGNPNPSPKTRFGQKGGNPGNKTKPGPGRPDEFVRQRAAQSWGKRIWRLEQIADGQDENQSVADSIAALRELRAVGFPDRSESKLDATLNIVIRDESARGEA